MSILSVQAQRIADTAWMDQATDEFPDNLTVLHKEVHESLSPPEPWPWIGVRVGTTYTPGRPTKE